MTATDYTPGDEPLSAGTLVQYEGGYYEITDAVEPDTHPGPPEHMPLAEAYPDGKAYHLWPSTMPKKMGNRAYSKLFVRRTSFRVVSTDGLKGGET